MSNYELDIDVAYALPTKKVPLGPPKRMSYVKPSPQYKTWGRNIVLLIQKAATLPSKEAQQAMIVSIIKLLVVTKNICQQDNLDVAALLSQIQSVAEGKLMIDSDCISTQTIFPDSNKERHRSGGQKPKSSRKKKTTMHKSQ